MADVDEDQRINDPHNAADTDLSDEAQDFRFLSSLGRYELQGSKLPETDSRCIPYRLLANIPPFFFDVPSRHRSDHATLPRRGEKDFEPHGTTHQASRLSASRDAMHQALSTVRIHNPRSQYVVGYWDATRTKCCVPQPRGPHFRNLGQADRSGQVWLLPEEALYLLERGNLDIRWAMPGHGYDEDDHDNDDDDLASVPMSLQGAYATMIGDESTGKISLERWNVYANLKRTGYTVIRAPTWTHSSSDEACQGTMMDHDDSSGDRRSTEMVKGSDGPFAFLRQLFSKLLRSRSSACLATRPLTTPGLYRNYCEHHPLSFSLSLSLSLSLCVCVSLSVSVSVVARSQCTLSDVLADQS